MPPPPKKTTRSILPPPRRISASKGPPPSQKLPETARVAVVRAIDGYKIVTTVCRLIVGARLDKGKSSWYPDSKTSGLTLAEAKTALEQWDKFLIEQESKKHEPTTAKKTYRTENRATSSTDLF
jgi:hypothetical protein